MSRVLIWKKITPGSEYDIFRGMDCGLEYTWRTTFNVGNRLWFQGIMSAIDTDENQYEFLTNEMSFETINSEFDFILFPMANIFNRKFRHYLEEQTFSKIRIPVYVIACGAQADNYDEMDSLINDIGEISKRFIGAVYNTGGEFALRGEFTKEFFDRLGFHSAVVTGCPSMYQLGKVFTATSCKTTAKPDMPVFNGNIPMLEELMKYYPNSLFMDQDTLWKELYFEHQDKPNFRSELAFYCNYGAYTAELLAEDRIRLIPDMYNWFSFLKKGGFDYSFGSRIHGSIMAILSGIPTTVVAIDTRTMEMADFFNIPYVKHIPGHIYTQEELVTLYKQADYTKFNETYQKQYQVYEDFLIKHGIISHVNQLNPYFGKDKTYIEPPSAVNLQYYKEMSGKLKKNKFILGCASAAVAAKNKVCK